MRGTRQVAVAATICVLLVSACTTTRPLCPAVPADDNAIYLVSRGWHTEIGVPAARLAGPLAMYRRIFPGARTIMFSYGKRTFVTAPPDTLSEYLLGPFPGRAAIQITALTTLPSHAYHSYQTTILPMSQSGGIGLSNFIWRDLAIGRSGAPKFIGPGPFRGSEFYAARSQYTLLHTCNTWSIEAMAAGGLPLNSHGVIFSGQTVTRAQDFLARRCEVETGFSLR